MSGPGRILVMPSIVSEHVLIALDKCINRFQTRLIHNSEFINNNLFDYLSPALAFTSVLYFWSNYSP